LLFFVGFFVVVVFMLFGLVVVFVFTRVICLPVLMAAVTLQAAGIRPNRRSWSVFLIH